MVEDDLPESPNCPDCGTMLEVVGSTEHPFYWCPQCKVARLN